MSKLIIANWKACLSPAAARNWVDVFSARWRPGPAAAEVVLAVPFLNLEEIARTVAPLAQVGVAAQNVSPYPPGSYTGAIPAAWLGEQVRYALVGHRERKKYFHETVSDIAAQVRECAAVNITPVLCLDDSDPAPIRAALDTDDLDRLVVAYTPEDAVSLERPRAQDSIWQAVERLRGFFPDSPFLYGGGVTPDNGAEILNLSLLDGVMLGRGCLDPEKFVRFALEVE